MTRPMQAPTRPADTAEAGAAPAADIMRRLREHTAALHAATEALPLMQALMRAPTGAVAYGHYLAALHGVYAATEPPLLLLVPAHVLTRLGVRPKLPALQRDLALLKTAPSPPHGGLASRLGSRIKDEAAALGGLYVLEGATLGGRVIARRLRARWPDAAQLPFAFLEHRGAAAAEWRRFGTELGRRTAQLAASEPGAPEAVLDGAVTVFQAMHDALGESRPA